ncbi:MAG TPA: hypothetical protein VFR84_16735 [Candidatus Angelobacter sp.]|nr:hypothetical protein [Candidatus Angelobacter sp.]
MPKHKESDPAPVMKSYGSVSRATLDTHGGVGLAGIAAVIGMGVIVAGRLDFGAGFLALAVVAGGVIALGLYWLRQRRYAKSATSADSSSGGFVGALILLGVGAVLMACRYYWMQLFFGLALLAGGAVALLLRWLRRRDSGISVV